MKKITRIMTSLLLAAPFVGLSTATAADEDKNGTTQTLAIGGETVERIVSEISINGNNAVLLFTNGSKLEVDMKDVSLTMAYDDATGVNSLRLDNGNGKVTVYNLQGQRMADEQQPNANGIYIVNGKKVTHKQK